MDNRSLPTLYCRDTCSKQDEYKGGHGVFQGSHYIIFQIYNEIIAVSINLVNTTLTP